MLGGTWYRMYALSTSPALPSTRAAPELGQLFGSGAEKIDTTGLANSDMAGLMLRIAAVSPVIGTRPHAVAAEAMRIQKLTRGDVETGMAATLCGLQSDPLAQASAIADAQEPAMSCPNAEKVWRAYQALLRYEVLPK